MHYKGLIAMCICEHHNNRLVLLHGESTESKLAEVIEMMESFRLIRRHIIILSVYLNFHLVSSDRHLTTSS